MLLPLAQISAYTWTLNQSQPLNTNEARVIWPWPTLPVLPPVEPESLQNHYAVYKWVIKFTSDPLVQVCHLFQYPSFPRGGSRCPASIRECWKPKLNSACLGLIELLLQNTIYRGAYKKQKLICHNFGRWKSKIRVPVWLVEGPLAGCRLLVCSHGRQGMWGPIMKALIPFMKALSSWLNHLPKVLLILSHWTLGFEVWILEAR